MEIPVLNISVWTVTTFKATPLSHEACPSQSKLCFVEMVEKEVLCVLLCQVMWPSIFWNVLNGINTDWETLCQQMLTLLRLKKQTSNVPASSSMSRSRMIFAIFPWIEGGNRVSKVWKVNRKWVCWRKWEGNSELLFFSELQLDSKWDRRPIGGAAPTVIDKLSPSSSTEG